MQWNINHIVHILLRISIDVLLRTIVQIRIYHTAISGTQISIEQM